MHADLENLIQSLKIADTRKRTVLIFHGTGVNFNKMDWKPNP